MNPDQIPEDLVTTPEPSFRTICFSLIEEIDRYVDLNPNNIDPNLGRLVAYRDSVVQTLKRKAEASNVPEAPTFEELQELWMSDVTMEQAASYPTRAVWFANTVLKRWGYNNA